MRFRILDDDSIGSPWVTCGITQILVSNQLVSVLDSVQVGVLESIEVGILDTIPHGWLLVLDGVGGGDRASRNDVLLVLDSVGGGWLLVLDSISGGDWTSGDDVLLVLDGISGGDWSGGDDLLVSDGVGELVNLLLSGGGGVDNWRVGFHGGNISIIVWSSVGGNDLVGGDWDGVVNLGNSNS